METGWGDMRTLLDYLYNFSVGLKVFQNWVYKKENFRDSGQIYRSILYWNQDLPKVFNTISTEYV